MTPGEHLDLSDLILVNPRVREAVHVSGVESNGRKKRLIVEEKQPTHLHWFSLSSFGFS